MSKKNYLGIGALVILVILLVAISSANSNQVTEIVRPNISINPPDQNSNLTTKPNPNPVNPNQLAGLAVELTEIKSGLNLESLKVSDLQNNSPEAPIEDTKHAEILCQPKNFDPKIRQFTKVSDPNLIPAEFYETSDDLDFGRFSITDPKNLILPEPFKITQYVFSCGSIQDSVVEIQASDQRIYLFQGLKDTLSQRQISSNGKFLYLNFYSLENQKYLSKKVIVDLLKPKIVDLSSYSCSPNGFWGSEYLFTLADSKTGLSSKALETNAQKVSICIFDQNGALKDAFQYKSIAQVSSGNLYTDIKLDSVDDYLSLYSGSVLSSQPPDCVLSVYSLKTKTLKEAIVGQADQTGTCPIIDVLKLQADRAVLKMP